MGNFFRRWVLGYDDDINLDNVITNAIAKRKKKPIQYAILDSLENNIDEWEFIKSKYSPGNDLSSYSFVNKENHISFKYSGLSYSMGIEFTDPIPLELENDNSSKLYEYIMNIWKCKMADAKEFLHEHVNAKNGFYYKSIQKEKINLLEFKFWCANNCEGKYYIDSNSLPDAPDYIEEYDGKRKWRKKQEDTGLYDYYKCWFEYDSDIVSIKLSKGW